MIGYDFTYNGVSFSDTGLPDINYFHLTNVKDDELVTRNEIVERSQYHGAFLGAVLASIRVIIIEGEIISENRVQRGILVDQLKNTFPLNPSPSFENLNMKEYSKKRDSDGQLLKVNAMVSRPIEFTDELNEDKNITKFRVELLCDDIAFKGEFFTINSTEQFDHGTTLLPFEEVEEEFMPLHLGVNKFEAVSTVDTVDQTIGGTGATPYSLTTGINEGATHIKTFLPTKKYQTKIGLNIIAKGTGDWTVEVHDSSDNIVASKTITNVNLTNGVENIFDLSWHWITGTYHYHVYSTVADGTVDTGTNNDLEDAESFFYYGRKTQEFKANQHGKEIQLLADEDGILHGASIDLNNKQFSFSDDYSDSVLSTVDLFSYTNTGNIIESGHLYAENGGVSNDPIYKINTIKPVQENITVKATGFSLGGGDEISIDISFNGVDFMPLMTLDDNIEFTYTGNIANGESIFYLKIRQVSGSIVGISQLTIEADLQIDIEPLIDYPTGNEIKQTITASLSSNAERIYYYENKYGFPAWEYTDSGAVYVGHILLPFDTTGLNIKIDDVLVSDGGFVSITATQTPSDELKATLTNNMLRLSSNDFYNIFEKKASHIMNVDYADINLESRGGKNFMIDNAVGDIPRTTNGYIENSKFIFFLVRSATEISNEFDSDVVRTGKFTLKLEATNITGIGSTHYGINQNERVPVKPNTKYKFDCFVKTLNAQIDSIDLTAEERDSSGGFQGTNFSNALTGDNNWTFLSIDFTTGANTFFIRLTFRLFVAGALQTAWYDLNSADFDVIEEHTKDSITNIPTGNKGGTTYWQGQKISLTGSFLSKVEIKKLQTAGSPSGDLVFELRDDNAGNPSSTVIATVTITKSAWEAYSVLDTIPIVFSENTTGTKWITVRSSQSESSGDFYNIARSVDNGSGGHKQSIDGGSSWTGGTFDLYMKTFSTPNDVTTLPASLSTKNSISFNYSGSSPSPLYIKITGPSTNPKILNTLTEKFFKVNVTIAVGDYIIIDTENSEVTDNLGNDLNKYIENGSQWLFAEAGSNILVFSDDTSPSLDPASIEIQYYNKYT